MANLLKETIQVLKANNKELKDILWFGTKENEIDATIEELFNIEYDDGFGSQKIANNLIVVGNSWWLERHEYDGSEWWEYKEVINRPLNKVKIERVDEGMWDTLEEINNIK